MPTPAPANDPRYLKERILREEIRALHIAGMRILQWGVTVLVSVQTALFFVRRDITGEYASRGLLHAGEPLPFHRYIIGSFFLLVLATIFSRMTYRTSLRLYNYKRQLLECLPSGIEELGRFPELRILGAAVYFVFPLLDVFLRLVIHWD
jgi:hypothetical protein